MSLLCVAEEDRLTCKCEALLAALSVVFAAIYIFNLIYPDEVSITLAFSQKVLFDVENGVKKDPEVSRLLKMLLSH